METREMTELEVKMFKTICEKDKIINELERKIKILIQKLEKNNA